MEAPASVTTDRHLVDREIARLRRRHFGTLGFPRPLEQQFETDTARERSRRLWIEGLLAIAFFNLCLLVDYLLVKDRMLGEMVKQAEIVTPLALLVNYMMRLDLKAWAREGSIAAGMVIICLINLRVEGDATAATTAFGLISVLITALFVNVVMRLRFLYAASSTALMLAAGLWYAFHATGMMLSEKIVGVSMMTLGMAITLMAGHSLEREERLSYLLFLNSELQGAELHRLSNIDKLTELPNRRAFEEHFEQLWTEGMLAGTPLSAIVIDIDHFKIVNDVYGHLYGDEVLRRVSSLLTQALRTQQDFAARFGGEEFVMLLPDTGLDKALVAAERVRRLVEMVGTPVPEQVAAGQTLWTTVSCGVSSCMPCARMGRERLLKMADRALYRAKGNGRNRVEYRPCETASSAHSNFAKRSSARRMLAKLDVTRDSGRH